MAIKPIRVFIDSDVVISSLMSKSGASYELLNHTTDVVLYVSNFSTEELEKVTNRLALDQKALRQVLNTRFSRVEIDRTYKEIQTEVANYVRDVDDAHIAAGAKEAKAAFLVSYNLRHFRAEKLRQDYKIILLTPGLFLQYLRSL